MFEGRVVAITGASSGIGEATALACAERGAAVALAARRAERVAALAERIEDDGGRALALPTDVGDERQARAFVEHAFEHLGRLDAVVNAAGGLRVDGPVEGADTERWREIVRVNLLGVLYCTHAALPVMRSQGGGQIVNVACAGARSAVGALTAAGVAAFSDGLREEAGRLGVRVIVVDAEPERPAAEVAQRIVDAIAVIEPTGRRRR